MNHVEIIETPNSGWISHIAYSPVHKRACMVIWRTKDLWVFDNIPPGKWSKWVKHSASPGSFYHREIKPYYEHSTVKTQ